MAAPCRPSAGRPWSPNHRGPGLPFRVYRILFVGRGSGSGERLTVPAYWVTFQPLRGRNTLLRTVSDEHELAAGPIGRFPNLSNGETRF